MTETVLWVLVGFNNAVFIWFCVMFYRWIKQTQAYVESVNAYCDYVISRSRAIYINQLHEMVDTLAKEERYEEANKINQILLQEMADMDEDINGERIDL